MADTTPRLNVSPTDPQSRYASISPLVVASCGVAILLVILLLVLGLSAFRSKLPLVEPWLFGVAAVGMVLAFAARRQVANSEGTLAGTNYSNLAWWACIIGGLGYGSYLFTIEWTIRADAEREFVAWTEHLKAADPENLDDPEMLKSIFLVLPANQRNVIANDASKLQPEQLQKVRQNFGSMPAFSIFRFNELFPILTRNKDRCQFITEGLKSWRKGTNTIDCELLATLKTPEGDYPMMVPMQAYVDEKTQVRTWQVMRPEGYIQLNAVRYTKHGWLIRQLEYSSSQAAGEFIMMASGRPNRQPNVNGMTFLPTLTQIGPRVAHDVYCTQTLPRSAGEQILDSTFYRAAVTGPLGWFWPGATNYQANLEGDFLAKLDRQTLTPEERRRLRFVHDNLVDGRLRLSSPSGIQGFPDKYITIRAIADRVEVSIPCEVKPSDTNDVYSAARGRIVLATADPAIVGEYAKARDGTPEYSNQIPSDFNKREISWRIVRIESDLKVVNYKPAGPSGGPGG